MNVVTGSFGYIGKYITGELLERGHEVKTITTHPDKPNPFGEQVQASTYNFEYPDKLIQYLAGCETLYNTYWVRFDYRQSSFNQALENTKILFNCAKIAGVKKIVHISVTNPSEDDQLPYYKGKALQEKALKGSGVNYTIVRPTLVFGKEDILVNNIAWTIRKFPIVPIFGSGKYQVQPVFVEDLAAIAVDASRSEESQIIDAIGPQTFTYETFLKLIAKELNRNIAFIHTSPSIGIFLGKMIGLFVKDIVLTKDELRGLMVNKLTSSQAPNGKTLFSDWLRDNKHSIGTGYTSELNRHFNWVADALPKSNHSRLPLRRWRAQYKGFSIMNPRAIKQPGDLESSDESRVIGWEMTPAETLSFFKSLEKKVITFFGYSMDYEDNQAMLKKVETVLAEYSPETYIVNIGATRGGIGAAYPIAKSMGFLTTGIVSSLALEYLKDVSTAVDHICFLSDDQWGGKIPDSNRLSPTSQAMVACSDILIGIGGGEISRDEMIAGREQGKPVHFYPAERNHRYLIRRAKRMKLDPPQSFWGAAHEEFSHDQN